MAQNWHQTHIGKRSFGDKVADGVASGMGSWPFIIGQSVFVAAWIALNMVGWWQHWDPYPFILLNLLFSTQAAYAAPVIMMSQNRQAERDREQAQADYDTNLRAETEVEQLRRALDCIQHDKLDHIISLLEGSAEAQTSTDAD